MADALKQIFAETLRMSEPTGRYPAATQCAVRITRSLESTAPLFKLVPLTPHECVIELFEEDCVEVARREALRENRRVVMLSMANDARPGGGVANGARAQEEHLCRTSNLYPTLRQHWYPLRDGDCILSRNVTAFRRTDLSMGPPFQVGIISMPAIFVRDQTSYSEYTHQKTLQKIRILCDTAHESSSSRVILVLSALGCGVFNNPPGRIAQAFYQVLVTERRAAQFHKVVFAIINDANARGGGNVRPFQAMFQSFIDRRAVV